MSKMSMSEAGRLGAKAAQETIAKQKALRIELYNNNPTSCPQCNKYISYEENIAKKRFCSQSCTARYYNAKRRPKLLVPLCFSCKAPASARNPWQARNFKFCNSACQNDFSYNAFISDWRSNKISGYRKGGYVSNHIRKYMILTHGEKCSKCGWAEINPFTKKVPIVLDHVDGNSTNCKEINLRLLCNNCDSLTATFKGANRGSGRVSRGNHVYAPKGYKYAI